MKVVLLLALLASCPQLLSAQPKSFRWERGVCELIGTYDAKQYTVAKLKNTLKLVEGFSMTQAVDATVWKYEDIKKLPDIAALDKEYESKSAEIKALDIIDTPYWQKAKQDRATELEQQYKLIRVTIQAYQNPAVLKDFPSAESCVKKYAAALTNGGEDLLVVWRQVNEASRRNNGNPERLRKIFEEQYNSPDKFKYAMVEVMSFGWWNCANGVRSVRDETELEKNFQKLFRRVRTQCEEP